MKKILLFLLISSKINAQIKSLDEFILKGKVNYPSDRYIYFVWYNADEERLLDSAYVSKGEFIYKGICNGYLDRFYIKSIPTNMDNNDSLNNVKIPIDNSEMKLELLVGQFSKFKITGCISCNLIKTLHEKYESFYYLNDLYQKKLEDSLLKNGERKNVEKLDEQNLNRLQNRIIKWCLKNPSNNLTPFYLYEWCNSIEPTKFEKICNTISEFQKNSFYGLKLKKIISDNYFRSHQKGTTAFSFKRIGYDNLIVNLKEVNFNSYVLLDFWASWCKPCRASHPKIVELYEKYKLKKFKIIGIADDDDNTLNWRNAIKQDSIFIWHHILRGHKSGYKDRIYDLNNNYFIQYLPTKILIDYTGKIIGRYEGEGTLELEKELKEIYKY